MIDGEEHLLAQVMLQWSEKMEAGYQCTGKIILHNWDKKKENFIVKTQR